MSDKKDAGTALVPAHIEPIDKALVPYIGYHQMAHVEKEKREALRDFMKTGALTTGSAAMTIVGIIISGAIPATAPIFLFAALIIAGGFVGTITGTFASFVNFMRLVRTNRMRALPPGTETYLAYMEGAAHALIETWNEKAEKWNEGWDLLVQEETDLFALQERCASEKSLRGLIKRIELVRKEKRKHLKVRAKLEVERDRIFAGIEGIRKRLPPPQEPLYLNPPDEEDEND